MGRKGLPLSSGKPRIHKLKQEGDAEWLREAAWKLVVQAALIDCLRRVASQRDDRSGCAAIRLALAKS